ncbi:glutathione S-transferase [Ketobacter sp. MCCC 1A13808]|uniref:glutathione S-transferase n=1 Tax=Ketobacter sp. MCCC 1A13808 TaxID=2602738 RepID=UPI0012ECB94D|nr:glutathione S-transferase [Ketobacter sp. MCCC 1A13808]MVF12170.1 glutathione S-transferase [Ketobacter sp. MCCC 1A13808]
MQLVGVPNSPYFRRTAISLELLELPFEVKPLSPFIDVQALGKLNPILKIPTLILDNGEKIMDSSLIIQYAELALSNGNTLWPREPEWLQSDFRTVSIALAALEKCLQIIYETKLRPESTRHQPWLDRVQGQCHAAFIELEQAVKNNAARYDGDCCQAGITAAIAWSFGAQLVASSIQPEHCPSLVSLTSNMEAHPLFKKYSATRS